MMKAKISSFPFSVRLAAILICSISAVYIAVVASEIITPLVFALLFAIVLLPLAAWLEKKTGLGRGAASGISILLFVAFISLILYVIGAQMSNLANDWPLFQQQLHNSIGQFQSWVETEFHLNLDKQKAYINDATSSALSTGSEVLGTTLLSVSSILLYAVLTFIYTFFLLLYRKVLIKFLVELVSDAHSTVVYDVAENIQLVIRKYILGLLLEMFIVAVLSCVAFALIGLKYFILLGLITALFNIVPYVGIFTALLLSALITFASAGVSSDLLMVVISIIIIHLIDSNILLPLIVGSKVSINAMVTVIGVVAGEMIWGISGMFLSVPVIAMLKIICDRVEALKPWATLLGHEKEEKKVLKIPLPKKKQVVVTAAEPPAKP